MINKLSIKLVTALAVVALTTTSSTAFGAGFSLAGKGSSFANGALQACAAAYTGDSVSYTSTGSGTGRTEFAAGNIDWAATDAPYTSGAPSKGFVTVPLFGGPIVFAYSAVGVGDGLNLTAEVVSGILKGTITRWDDEKIKALNPRVKLPKKAIKVAYRSSGSGTNSNLTNYLNQNVGGWTKGSSDMVSASGGIAPGAVSFATSQLLAAYIEDNSNAFGYFDLSDAVTADVAIAKLRNAAGVFVAPTASAAARFLSAQAVVTGGTDATNGTLSIDFTKVVSGGYQLSVVVYGLAPKRISGTTSVGKGKAIQDWFKYVVSTCSPSRAAGLGYAPLGGTLKTSALNQIKLIG